ncbi:MAG: putative porin [Bdellovibrionaceae bacterium]|nr:putative porin [Pseudobdellovibrionaceae bacterium]
MNKYLLSSLLVSNLLTVGQAVALEIGDSAVLKTDVRLRNQLVKVEDQKDRFHQRLRGRIAIEGQANEKVKIGARLATSQGNKATSTNTDLGGSDSAGFKEHTVWVDKFYFAWAANENLTVTGGKFDQPFFKAGKSELLFDNDLTPEGVNLHYTCKCSDDFNWWATASGQWVDEVHSTTPGSEAYADATLGGFQAGVNANMGGVKWTIGASKYDYNNLDNTTALGTLPSTEGYKLTNAFLEVNLEAGEMPIKIYADYVTNSEADDDKSGYLVGVKVNKAKEAGSWDADVFMTKLEPNANIKSIADGDINHNDVEATRVTFNYMLAENSKVRLSYLTTKQNASTSTDSGYDVGQLDFEFKF